MKILKNKYFIISYRIIAIIICLIGIYLNIFIDGKWHFTTLLYYTLLSNILCLILFISLIFKMIVNKDKEATNYLFKGSVIIIVLVTMIVFHFILRPTMFSMINSAYLMSLPNIIVHYLVPIITIFDWVLFDKKGEFSFNYPMKWLILPFCYWLFTVIYGMTKNKYPGGNNYPYFFFDIDKYGLIIVLRNVIVIAFLFLILGYLLVLIDKFLKNKFNK